MIDAGYVDVAISLNAETHAEFDRVARRVAADIVTWDALDQPDTSGDIDDLRESLIRHRVAAAAMQQSHSARAVVIDVYLNDDATSARMVVATPTGDRRDEREAMVEAQTAARLVSSVSAQMYERARLVAFLFPWLLGGES